MSWALLLCKYLLPVLNNCLIDLHYGFLSKCPVLLLLVRYRFGDDHCLIYINYHRLIVWDFIGLFKLKIILLRESDYSNFFFFNSCIIPASHYLPTIYHDSPINDLSFIIGISVVLCHIVVCIFLWSFQQLLKSLIWLRIIFSIEII